MATVQALKEAYSGEWLAIAIPEGVDVHSAEGELVFHSLDEHEVWRAIKGDRRRIYVTYAGSLLPEGYAARF